MGGNRRPFTRCSAVLLAAFLAIIGVLAASDAHARAKTTLAFGSGGRSVILTDGGVTSVALTFANIRATAGFPGRAVERMVSAITFSGANFTKQSDRLAQSANYTVEIADVAGGRLLRAFGDRLEFAVSRTEVAAATPANVILLTIRSRNRAAENFTARLEEVLLLDANSHIIIGPHSDVAARGHVSISIVTAISSATLAPDVGAQIAIPENGGVTTMSLTFVNIPAMAGNPGTAVVRVSPVLTFRGAQFTRQNSRTAQSPNYTVQIANVAGSEILSASGDRLEFAVNRAALAALPTPNTVMLTIRSRSTAPENFTVTLTSVFLRDSGSAIITGPDSDVPVHGEVPINILASPSVTLAPDDGTRPFIPEDGGITTMTLTFADIPETVGNPGVPVKSVGTILRFSGANFVMQDDTTARSDNYTVQIADAASIKILGASETDIEFSVDRAALLSLAAPRTNTVRLIIRSRNTAPENVAVSLVSASLLDSDSNPDIGFNGAVIVRGGVSFMINPSTSGSATLAPGVGAPPVVVKNGGVTTLTLTFADIPAMAGEDNAAVKSISPVLTFTGARFTRRDSRTAQSANYTVEIGSIADGNLPIISGDRLEFFVNRATLAALPAPHTNTVTLTIRGRNTGAESFIARLVSVNLRGVDSRVIADRSKEVSTRGSASLRISGSNATATLVVSGGESSFIPKDGGVTTLTLTYGNLPRRAAFKEGDLPLNVGRVSSTVTFPGASFTKRSDGSGGRTVESANYTVEFSAIGVTDLLVIRGSSLWYDVDSESIAALPQNPYTITLTIRSRNVALENIVAILDSSEVYTREGLPLAGAGGEIVSDGYVPISIAAPASARLALFAGAPTSIPEKNGSTRLTVTYADIPARAGLPDAAVETISAVLTFSGANFVMQDGRTAQSDNYTVSVGNAAHAGILGVSGSHLEFAVNREEVAAFSNPNVFTISIRSREVAPENFTVTLTSVFLRDARSRIITGPGAPVAVGGHVSFDILPSATLDLGPGRQTDYIRRDGGFTVLKLTLADIPARAGFPDSAVESISTAFEFSGANFVMLDERTAQSDNYLVQIADVAGSEIVSAADSRLEFAVNRAEIAAAAPAGVITFTISSRDKGDESFTVRPVSVSLRDAGANVITGPGTEILLEGHLSFTIGPPFFAGFAVPRPSAVARVTADPGVINENGGRSVITVALDQAVPPGEEISLAYAIALTGAAADDVNYMVTLPEGSEAPLLVFAAGDREKDIIITGFQDDDDENEMLTFTITGHGTLTPADVTAAIAIRERTADMRRVKIEIAALATVAGTEQVGLAGGLIRRRVLAFAARETAPAPDTGLTLADNPKTMGDMINGLGLDHAVDADGGGQYAVWARGSYSSMEGNPTVDGMKIDYDGDSTGLGVGVEKSTGDYVAGVAINWLSTDLDLRSEDNEGLSRYEESLVMVAPYVALRRDNGRGIWNRSIWLSAGYGTGTADGTTAEDALTASADIAVTFLNVGADFVLSTNENGELIGGLSGLAVSKTVDSFTFADIGPISKTSLSTFRGQGEVTYYRPLEVGEGRSVRPYIGLATLHDAGDRINDDSHALDLRGGVDFNDARVDLSLEASTELLREDHKSWTISGSARYQFAPDGLGISLALDGSHESIMGLEGGYGMAMRRVHRDAMLTPFAGIRHGSGSGELSSGMRFAIGGDMDADVKAIRRFSDDEDTLKLSFRRAF